MRSPLCAAALAAAALLVLAGCVTTSSTIEGHKVRGTAEPPVEVLSDGYLHRAAPQWFRDGWRDYLDQAGGNFAVLAVDRNLKGWGYVRCIGAQCRTISPTGRSWREVNYKHGALDNCRESVRDNHPAHRPDCAIYAIGDKIVWKGRMPWE